MEALRAIHLITYLTAIIIMAAYAAALISFLAIKTDYIPFTTMQGLIDDNTYKMGVVTGSSDHILLKVQPMYRIFALSHCLQKFDGEIGQYEKQNENEIFITFQNTKTGVLRTLYEKYMAPYVFYSTERGLELVCGEGKFALMGAVFDLAYAYHDLNCTLQLLDAAWVRPSGWLISKNTPYREAFNRLLVFHLRC